MSAATDPFIDIDNCDLNTCVDVCEEQAELIHHVQGPENASSAFGLLATES